VRACGAIFLCRYGRIRRFRLSVTLLASRETYVSAQSTYWYSRRSVLRPIPMFHTKLLCLSLVESRQVKQTEMPQQIQYNFQRNSMDDMDLKQNNKNHVYDDDTVVSVPRMNHPIINNIIINRFDVVLGRGKGTDKHFGNQTFQRTLLSLMFSIYVRTQRMFTHITLAVVQPRQNITNRLLLFHFGLFFLGGGDTSKCIDLIRANVHRYVQALSNENKRIITLEIMDEIHQSAGRFLKHAGQRCWMEIAPDEARRKVAQAIQYQRRASSSTCSSTRVVKCLQMKCDTNGSSSSSSSSSNTSSTDSNHEHPPPPPYSTHAATATYRDVWNLDSEPLSLVDVLCRSPDHQHHHHPERYHPCSSHQTTNSDIHDTSP
jgi:uncharacterized protein YaaW (UPF0174 family)